MGEKELGGKKVHDTIWNETWADQGGQTGETGQAD